MRGGDNRMPTASMIYGLSGGRLPAAERGHDGVAQRANARQRMFGVESPIQSGFHRRDPSPRIVISHAQQARHPVHLFPGGEGQHPIGILPQFRQRIAGPDLSNLVSQMEIKTVLIEKRNDAGLIGYGAPRLHQFLSAFCREHPGEFLHVPLAQHCTEILSELLPQSPGLGLSNSESVERRMPHEEVDDEPAAGRD